MNSFVLTDYADGCAHYERADGYVIDWFVWTPNGGSSVAVLVDAGGEVVGYYDSPEEAAAWANIMESAS